MKVAIVVIGDEILSGLVTDTNSGYLSRTIDPLGWRVEGIEVVGDNRADIAAAVNRALDRADIVLTTGGLGPTRDDITKQALIDVFGGSLRHDAGVLANAEAHMARRGLAMNALTATQALVPTSCRPLINTAGTAPVMLFSRDGRHLAAMPGVPAETTAMFPSAVLPELMRLTTGAGTGPTPVLAHRFVIVSGIPESAIAERLAQWEDGLDPALHLAYLPDAAIVRLRLDAAGTDQARVATLIDTAHAELRSMMAPYLVNDTGRSLARTVIDRLAARGLMMATAESCTGGNIAHTITIVPGSSAVMAGGVVAYSNRVKEAVLGVDPAVIAAQGAVSLPVAAQMASGALEACSADVAVSTTGIAGPSGAVEGKPVGTVCIGVAGPWGVASTIHHFPGSRERVIYRATQAALLALLRALAPTP